MSRTVSLEAVYRPVQESLDEVRALAERMWREALGLVAIDTASEPAAEGKMLRPALCLLAAGVIGADTLQPYVNLAAAFETLHLASLIHDDVVDHARLRRGYASLNALWDNRAAVLGGDYLVARALELLTAYDSCTMISGALVSLRRMAEGELRFAGRDGHPLGEEECLMLAERKTASLFAEACGAPAHLIDAQYRPPLCRFGTAFGIAFQLVDDILDITQPVSSLGKPSCGDVVEGKKTLPIQLMREALDPEERRRLDALQDMPLSDQDRTWIAAAAGRTGAVLRTEQIARRYADKALGELQALPDTEYRASMAELVEFILVRES